MLVLSRKKNETIVVEGPCTITVLRTSNGSVRLGIQAGKETRILRGEIALFEEPEDGDAEEGGAAA